MKNKILSVILRIIQFISWLTIVGDVFGALPVLFGMDHGAVTPEDWKKARVSSLIIPFVALGVGLGAKALQQRLDKQSLPKNDYFVDR